MEKVENNVLLGNEEYLFLFQGMQREFDYLQKIKIISPLSIDNFTFNIKQRIFYFRKHQIHYKHIVFASKPLVKSRFLPKEYSNIYSLFNEYYKDKCSDFKNNIFYTLSLLLEEEKNFSTFLKYDTHMTDRAYLSICKYLCNSFNIPYDEEFEQFFHFKVVDGDLSRMLTNNKRTKEEYFNKNPHVYEEGNKNVLRGNTDDVLIHYNSNAKTQKRLLIFGDSFLRGMMNILSYFFKDIVYIRSTFVHYDIVEMFQPDIVLTGNAERYLKYVESEQKSNNFLLSKYGDDEYSPSKEYLDAFKAQLSYHYYPNIYREWKEKYILMNPLDLSISKLSKDILLNKKEKDSSIFKVIGIDPYIIFNYIAINENKNYMFIIKFHSNVDSIFQLFYTTTESSEFSERNSIKKEVLVGMNHITISLQHIILGNRLRIDPLMKIGEIKIYDYRLEEIND